MLARILFKHSNIMKYETHTKHTQSKSIPAKTVNVIMFYLSEKRLPKSVLGGQGVRGPEKWSCEWTFGRNSANCRKNLFSDLSWRFESRKWVYPLTVFAAKDITSLVIKWYQYHWTLVYTDNIVITGIKLSNRSWSHHKHYTMSSFS